MRTIKAQSYIQKNREKFARNRLKILAERKERAVRRRPRDTDEEKILITLTGLRWKKWQEKGIIKKLGERKFQVKIF